MTEFAWLPHQSNITAKLTSPSYKGSADKFMRFLGEVYGPYKEAQLEISGVAKDHVRRRVDILEKYYEKVDELVDKLKIKSQSKFRPTVFEEFCGFLFKDVPEISALGLSFYGKKIFAGIGLSEDGTTRVKTKDVDFCIGKEVQAEFNGNESSFIIPVVAVECKTYTDKTMLSEAQFTALTLKNGAPNVKVYILSETNRVALTEIPNQTPIDQYFVLRADEDDPIDADVLWDFFSEVREALKRTRVVDGIKIPGRLILR